MDLKKIISIIVIIILVLNLALFLILKYSEVVFWGIIIIGFIVSLIVKKLNNRSAKPL